MAVSFLDGRQERHREPGRRQGRHHVQALHRRGHHPAGVTDYNRQDIEALFKQGRVAMILSGPWLRGQIRRRRPKLNYSLARIPKGTTQATYGVTDSS